jgi:hypothetical protein
MNCNIINSLMVRKAAVVLNLNFSPAPCELTNYLIWSCESVPVLMRFNQGHITFFPWRHVIRMRLSADVLEFPECRICISAAVFWYWNTEIDIRLMVLVFPVWWPVNKNSPTVTHACRKRRLKWVATLPLGDINRGLVLWDGGWAWV